jgi:hypothetical protein
MKISNKANTIAHYDDGTSLNINQNELLADERNKFFGWTCWAGVQEISIDADGEVWSCVKKAGTKLGNIHTGFTMSTQPLTCNKQQCTCAADLQISKAKPGHEEKLRVKYD